jgi:predicted lysophospholipase L1 biosynthesis ABC-type transport system permease subunit
MRTGCDDCSARPGAGEALTVSRKRIVMNTFRSGKTDQGTRELGLLRAVGMTRGQLRSMVRAEALVTSAFGALEGLVLGVFFGRAIVYAMRSLGATQLDFPVPQLAATRTSPTCTCCATPSRSAR